MIHTTTKLALKQLPFPPNGLRALEIGCASCEETVYLGNSGLIVDAVDLTIGESHLVGDIETIHLHQTDILKFELSDYDLIIANLVLPFIPKASFPLLWEDLIDAMKPDGVIAGHFFGIDDWKVIEGYVWSVRDDDLLELLAELNLVHLKENRVSGPNQKGTNVYKHNFEWVATK